MRERIRDKERLEHILAAIDVLEKGGQRHTVEEAEEDAIIFFRPQIERYIKEESEKSH